MLRLEGVVAGRYVEQRQRPERAADGEERDERLGLLRAAAALQVLAVKHLHVAADLQRLRGEKKRAVSDNCGKQGLALNEMCRSNKKQKKTVARLVPWLDSKGHRKLVGRSYEFVWVFRANQDTQEKLVKQAKTRV